jgi:hypothetical protein
MPLLPLTWGDWQGAILDHPTGVGWDCDLCPHACGARRRLLAAICLVERRSAAVVECRHHDSAVAVSWVLSNTRLEDSRTVTLRDGASIRHVTILVP